MRSWFTALRIARRELRRSKGRSLLVVLLIGLPVLAISFAAATYDTFTPSPAEKVVRTMGGADALVDWPQDGPVVQSPEGEYTSEAGAPRTRPATAVEIRNVLPAGSTVAPWTTGLPLSIRTRGGEATVEAEEVDYAAPVARGIYRQVAGRAPASADEVALSPSLAERAGVHIGDRLTSADGIRSWRISGLVQAPGNLSAQVALLRPGTLSGDVSGSGFQTQWLADTPAPVRWPAVKQLNRRGVVVTSRAVALDPPPADQVDLPKMPAVDSTVVSVGAVAGGLLVLETVLLAGPAFAVGARRRRRDLALVAAAGGTAAHLRRIVLADGLVLGALAAVAGTVLGVLAAYLGRPLSSVHLADMAPGGFRVMPAALAGVAALAVASGLLAALVPAWTAGRLPVVAALRGRSAPGRVRRRWAVVGLLMCAAGAAVTVYGGWESGVQRPLAGLALGELGVVLCVPTLVSMLAGFGGRLPLAARIAVRDMGRNRAASASAISAVLAAVAVSVLAGTVLLSDQATQDANRPPGTLPAGYAAFTRDTEPTAGQLAAMTAAVRTALPVSDVVTIRSVYCGDKAYTTCRTDTVVPAANLCPLAVRTTEPSAADRRAARDDPRCTDWGAGRNQYSDADLSEVVVVEPDDLAALTDAPGRDVAAATAVLRAGGVVVTNPSQLVGGKVTVDVSENLAETGVGDGRPARTATLPGVVLPAGVASPQTIYAPETVRRLGLTTHASGLVAATSRVPTQAETDRLTELKPAGWRGGVEQEPPYERDLAILILAIAAAVITLGAAAIATGLAAAEGRSDLATLGAVGASPIVRRALTLSQTGLIAGLGSMLGVGVGLAAAAVIVAGRNRAGADAWPPPPDGVFAVDWLSIGITLVVVPAVAMLGAGLLTRSRLPIERRL